MNTAFVTVAALSERLRRGAVTSSQIVDAVLTRIEAEDGHWGAFATLARAQAIRDAVQADREMAKGQCRGPLHGVPFAAKDLLASGDIPTEVGMPAFKGRTTDHVATAITRLRDAGAVLIGKLTQTEGTFGGYHANARAPLNPWNAEYWPGASSSGPGVALAAGLCPAALASDTGGSIRTPSAACGVTGLLPSRGLVSRFGAFPLAWSMDAVGPMAHTAEDCALLLTAVAGYDPKDPVTLDRPVPLYTDDLARPVRSLCVGINETALAGVDPEVKGALDHVAETLAKAGVRLKTVRFPETRAALEGWVSVCAAEAALAHRETYRVHGETYGPALRGLIELGLRVTSLELAQAFGAFGDLQGAMTNLLAEVDALLVPVSLAQTPPAKVFADGLDIRAAYPANSRFVGTFSITGQPTVTFPAGMSRAGLPLGAQLAGARFTEATLLRLVHHFQRATDWHLLRPPGIAA